MSEKQDLIELTDEIKKSLCKICDEVKKQVEAEVLHNIDDVMLSFALKMNRMNEKDKKGLFKL